MRSRFVRPVGIGMALAAAFAAGRLSVTPKPAAEGLKLETLRSASASAAGEGAFLPERQTLPGAQTSRPENEKAHAADLVSRVFSEPAGFARVRALHAALEEVTAENWRTVFDVFWRAHTQGLDSEDEYRLVLNRLGEVAGAAACERFKPKDPIGQAETHNGRFAMAGWAQTDPGGALSYVQSLPQGRFREGMLWGYVAGVGTRDPQAALRALAEAPSRTQSEWLRGFLSQPNPNVFEPLARRWLGAADSDAGQAPEELNAQRRGVLDALFSARDRRSWADGDGTKLAQFVDEFAGKPFLGPGPVAGAAFKLASKQGYPEAVAWAEKHAQSDPSNASPAIGAMLARWARSDGAAVAGWLETHREAPFYDQSVAAFIHTADIDAPTAQAWAETIQDPNLRASLIGQAQQMRR